MNFYNYKSKKKSYGKKGRFRKNRGLSGGLIRFAKLSIIVLLIVPVIYMADKAIAIAHSRLAFSMHPMQYFKIKTIKVTGNKFVTEEELSPYLNEFHDKNILKADLKNMMFILKEHPWIKDVAVKRELPSSILVNITERMPAVYINSKGKRYLADEEGVILGEKPESMLNLPVIYGISLSGYGKNTGEKVSTEGMQSALELKKELASLPWIDISTAGIEVGDRAQITLHLKDYSIRLGKGRYKEKLKRFYELTNNLKDKGNSFKEVDLRFENQVIVKTTGT